MLTQPISVLQVHFLAQFLVWRVFIADSCRKKSVDYEKTAPIKHVLCQQCLCICALIGKFILQFGFFWHGLNSKQVSEPKIGPKKYKCKHAKKASNLILIILF